MVLYFSSQALLRNWSKNNKKNLSNEVLTVKRSNHQFGGDRSSGQVWIRIGNRSEHLLLLFLQLGQGGRSWSLGSLIFLKISGFDGGFGYSRQGNWSDQRQWIRQHTAPLAALGISGWCIFGSGSSGIGGFLVQLEEFDLGSCYFLQFNNSIGHHIFSRAFLKIISVYHVI